ncbi:MAG TPA: COX15/CtaA family protein [Gemmatimonadales bacterium]|nr:COX15/CtaA family protein [Gemmatimonadales bacterium]
MTLDSNRPVRIWLLTGCALIAAMVTIGGITRLTGSGLSITEWDVVTGALPPLSEAHWQELFARYQATPQYQQINAHFGLGDFKRIFWWEYIHRGLGRAIGLVFLVPFLFFLVKGYFNRPLRNRVLLIFGLGAFQGVLGWLMVASGLVDRPSVSHYRLAAHLLTALLTFGVTLWVALTLAGRRAGGQADDLLSARIRAALTGFAVLLGLQLMYGAFVAGLRAGGMFNTFPLMGGALVPPGLGTLTPAWRNLTENPVMVQFIHRLLGFLLLGLGVWLWPRLTRAGYSRHGRLLGIAVILQFLLGVVTILRFPASPVFWGAVHQAGAVFLLTAVVLALHATRRLVLPDTVESPAPGRVASGRLVPTDP